MKTIEATRKLRQEIEALRKEDEMVTSRRTASKSAPRRGTKKNPFVLGEKIVIGPSKTEGEVVEMEERGARMYYRVKYPGVVTGTPHFRWYSSRMLGAAKQEGE